MKCALLFFFLISISAIAEELNPKPRLYSGEIAAIQNILAHIISPLKADFAQEIKKADAFAKIGQAPSSFEKEKREYHCYVQPREWFAYLSSLEGQEPGYAKRFIFTRTCNISGTVTLAPDAQTIDLTLKNYQSFYRLQLVLQVKSAMVHRGTVRSFKFKILDGKLFTAKQKYIPHMEFLGDYAIVVNKNLSLLENMGGSLYIKAVDEKKADHLVNFKLQENTP